MPPSLMADQAIAASHGKGSLRYGNASAYGPAIERWPISPNQPRSPWLVVSRHKRHSVVKPPLPKSAKLTLPEAVSLITEAFDCSLYEARDALERAMAERSISDISTRTLEGEEISTPWNEWLEINWDTGEVKKEASYSGSPPDFVTIIPFLMCQEVERYFRIDTADATPKSGSARDYGADESAATDRGLEGNDPLANRIEAVLLEGTMRLKRNQSLTIRRIAERMVDDGDGQEFKAETIRKILSGRYEPARRRGFHRLGAPVSDDNTN